MKARFFGNLNPNLADATLNLLVRPIVLRVPINAPVQDLHQLLRQRVANGKPATTISHGVKMYQILFHALRIPTNIVHLVVIIFRQHRNEVVGEEHGVIVTHHEPPHILQP